MRRRYCLGSLSASGAFAAAAPLVSAQIRNKPLIGYFAGGKRAVVADLVSAFQRGLAELGWAEGGNVDVAYRFAEAQPDRVPSLAKEIVGLKPSVILAGAVDAAVAVHKLTATIPIV